MALTFTTRVGSLGYVSANLATLQFVGYAPTVDVSFISRSLIAYLPLRRYAHLVVR
jgi:hypothetical protein